MGVPGVSHRDSDKFGDVSAGQEARRAANEVPAVRPSVRTRRMGSREFIMSKVDDMFSPGGFAVALQLGIEPTVYLSDSILSGVTVSKSDLRCARCDCRVSVPKTKPALFLAVNKRYNDGLCRRCDPVVGPRTPPDFDG